MNPERLSNPYAPPSERGTPSRPVACSVGVAFSAALTLVSSSLCAYFIHAATKLKSAYPDFHDPSPDVDGYWPGVVYTINIGFGLVAGAFTALSGLVLIAIIFANRRAAKLATAISDSDETT